MPYKYQHFGLAAGQNRVEHLHFQIVFNLKLTYKK